MNVMKNVLKSLLTHIDFLLMVLAISIKSILMMKMLGLSYQNIYMREATIGAVVVLFSWTLLFKRRTRIIVLLVTNIILTFILFSDLLYFRYFSDVISIPVLLQAFQLDALGGSITNLLRLSDLILWLDLLAFLPAGVFYFIVIKGKEGKQGYKGLILRFVKTIIVLAVGVFLFYQPIDRHIEKYGKGLFLNIWSHVSLVNTMGVFGFHGYDSYLYLKDHVFGKKVLSEEELKQVEDYFTQYSKQVEKTTPYYGLAKGKNVIVVQIEGMQNFVINREINGKEITPNLNKFVRENIYFDNFYHQVAQARTADAEFLSNVSLYPLTAGSVYIQYPNNDFLSLSNILKENGYKSFAMHAYEPSFWNRFSAYQKIGFDRFYSIKDYTIDEKVGWSLGDESFFRQNLAFLKEQKGPYHSLMITLSSHHPYTIPNEYKELDLGKYEGTDFGNYIHSMRYVDKAIGSFVQQLKDEGLWENTLLVMYGDHDSGTLNDDGEMYQFIGGKGEMTPYEFTQMQWQVPFLIHIPGYDKTELHNQVVGQIDITPTILHLLGMEKGKYMLGQNAFDSENRLVIFRYGSFTNGDLFYRNSMDGIYENGKLYDSNGEEIDLEQGKALYKKAIERLKISDLFLQGNLLNKLTKETK